MSEDTPPKPVAPKAPAKAIANEARGDRTYEVTTTVNGSRLETVTSVEQRFDVVQGAARN